MREYLQFAGTIVNFVLNKRSLSAAIVDLN